MKTTLLIIAAMIIGAVIYISYMQPKAAPTDQTGAPQAKVNIDNNEM